MGWKWGGEGVARTEVEEELAQDVEDQERLFGQAREVEADDAQEDCKDCEAHELNRAATDDINKGDCKPISRDRPSADEDKLADSGVMEEHIDVVFLVEADGAEDAGAIEVDAVKGDIK
jgi:hypothetical protein